MRILFTGGSSFTGYWFIKALAEAGHQVTATFRKASADRYKDSPAARVGMAVQLCDPLFDCAFGDDRFIEAIGNGRFDLLCNHGAEVTNYKSPDFDVAAAVASNTHRLDDVTKALKESGCGAILLTGSVFESDEGDGTRPLIDFSPYGRSKAETAKLFKLRAEAAGMTLGKFVIPNPFGPYENFRFTSFLAHTWLDRKVAEVSAPDYVRDNIHVCLLAKAYAEFAGRVATSDGFVKTNPSQYAGPTSAFVELFSTMLRAHLNVPCEFKLLVQKDFSEPLARFNTDKLDTDKLDWIEAQAWEQLAAYYLQTFERRQ